ncbi:hypothetical protein [Ramlibacter tataouinensis]|uniref:hypothetical protein n=1 Tax=Ramlibacter tataouinensis TaxID=94132 RepID=UPI0002F23A96|nr:hypothetical protein [Ramlibacter tataouinensis]
MGDLLDAPAQVLESAALLVTHGATGLRPLDWFQGTRAERLVRRFSVPVLVVKQPAGRRYRRVLVGVKLDPRAGELIARASKVSPSARVDVLHVLGTSHEYRLQLADAPEAARRAQRLQVVRDAYRKIEAIIAAAAGHASDAAASLVFGSAPGRLVEVEPRCSCWASGSGTASLTSS